jgi:hypothetical protein
MLSIKPQAHILTRFLTNRPYDYRSMYLSAHPSHDYLSSGISASLLQFSLLTESPLIPSIISSNFLGTSEDHFHARQRK